MASPAYLDWIAAETRSPSAAAARGVLASALRAGCWRPGLRGRAQAAAARAGVSLFGARARRQDARSALCGRRRLLPLPRQAEVRRRPGNAPGSARPSLPPGKVKEDEFFGKVETYRGDVVVRLPLPTAAAGKSLVLVADSQGCADVGVCYPVNRQKVTLALPAAGQGSGRGRRGRPAQEELVQLSAARCSGRVSAHCRSNRRTMKRNPCAELVADRRGCAVALAAGIYFGRESLVTAPTRPGRVPRCALASRCPTPTARNSASTNGAARCWS